MSYHRNGMGDGPITSTSQVDDTMIPTVPPTRVSCDALAPDSPWRNPGQVCAPTAANPNFLTDLFAGLFTPSSPADPAAAAANGSSSGTSHLLLLAAAGGLGYYLLTRKSRSKKTRS